MPKNILIEGKRISDWNSFHDTFADTLGFPSFYGRNMDAWIDCMTCLDDPEAGMTSTHTLHPAMLSCFAYLMLELLRNGALRFTMLSLSVQHSLIIGALRQVTPQF